MAVARAESALATAVASRNHLYVEAEGLLRHALSVERAQPAPDHAALADTLSTLGYCLSNQPARVAEAEPLVAEALSHARAAWGEHSTSYLAVLNRLGNYQLGRWDFAGAETVFRQIIALQDQIQPGSPGNLTPEWNLCICLFNQDKLDEMEVVLNRLEADSRQLVGEGSVQFAIANGVRACLDFGRGEYGAAVPCLERALKTLSANFPPDQVTVVQCQALLGLCLTRDGYPAEGEPMLRAAFSNGAKTDHRHFDHTFGDLEAALGECMLAQKRYAEAEPLLLTSLDDLEKRLGAQNHLTIEATRRLHDLYIAWNKSEQAAQFTGNDSDHPASKP